MKNLVKRFIPSKLMSTGHNNKNTRVKAKQNTLSCLAGCERPVCVQSVNGL